MLAAILAAAGLCACSNDSDEAEGRTELSKGNTVTEELADSPQLLELKYPVTELEYPSHELSGAVTDITDE